MTDAQEPAGRQPQPNEAPRGPWEAVPPQSGPPPGQPSPYQYGYPYGPAPSTGANGLAIASMVLGICGFLCLVPGIVGIILGFVSLPQIKRGHQSGRGMAITGIVTGFAWPALLALFILTDGNH